MTRNQLFIGTLAKQAGVNPLGFTLSEIKDIVAVRRQGLQPCAHVRSLVEHVEQKIVDLDQMLADLLTLRKRLQRLLVDWKGRAKHHRSTGVVCPHIEGEMLPSRGSR